MAKEYLIRYQLLNQVSFQPFGTVIAPEPNQEPNIFGDGWQCWYPLGRLQTNYQQQIGIVRSESGYRTVSRMERHENRKEWVFAIDKPVIQVVSLPSDKEKDRPNPENAMAFLLLPGQGVLINNGIWHAAGIAPGEDQVLYGFVLGKKSEAEGEDSGMIPFKNNEIITIAEK